MTHQLTLLGRPCLQQELQQLQRRPMRSLHLMLPQRMPQHQQQLACLQQSSRRQLLAETIMMQHTLLSALQQRLTMALTASR